MNEILSLAGHKKHITESSRPANKRQHSRIIHLAMIWLGERCSPFRRGASNFAGTYIYIYNGRANSGHTVERSRGGALSVGICNRRRLGQRRGMRNCAHMHVHARELRPERIT